MLKQTRLSRLFQIQENFGRTLIDTGGDHDGVLGRIYTGRMTFRDNLTGFEEQQENSTDSGYMASMYWRSIALIVSGIGILFAAWTTLLTQHVHTFDKQFFQGFGLGFVLFISGFLYWRYEKQVYAQKLPFGPADTLPVHAELKPNITGIIVWGALVFPFTLLCVWAMSGSGMLAVINQVALGLASFFIPVVLLSPYTEKWCGFTTAALNRPGIDGSFELSSDFATALIKQGDDRKNVSIGMLAPKLRLSANVGKEIPCHIHHYPDGQPAVLVANGARVWLRPQQCPMYSVLSGFKSRAIAQDDNGQSVSLHKAFEKNTEPK